MESLRDRLARALGDRYRLEAELGQGGMAVVYRAHDLKHDRAVALKVLRPELASRTDEPERFLREIRLVARLAHPHILPLHDSGEKDGLLYYVMPLVGRSLRDRIGEEGALSVQEALDVACAVAYALHYAHERDVLHRDVKPENILFNAGFPLVTDFGVARAITLACDAVTARGVAVGTPAYMSPEQASGDDALDGRSDQYALACVLYEMLTGEPPFREETARRVMMRHAIDPVPAVRVKRPDVPAGMAAALDRALAKEPDDRFPTVAEFAAALRSGDAVGTARPAGQLLAVLPFVNAGGDPKGEYLSDGLTDELINALARVEGLRVASRTSVFALKGKQQDVRAIGAHLNASAVLEGTVRQAGNRLRITAQLSDTGDGRLLWSERFDREFADVFDLQDEIASSIVTTLRRTLLRDLGEVHPRRYTENVTAYNLYLKGRYFWNRRRPDDLREAIRQFEAAISQDPSFALAYTGLADSYALQLDYGSVPVQEGFDRARAEAERALALDEGLAEAHTSLGWVQFIYDWDFAGAERHFRRALEIDSRYATAHQWYAWLLLARRRLEDALSEASVGVELDPASVSPRRSLGWAYYYARRPDDAIVHMRHALRLDPLSDESHRILGLAYHQRGDMELAEAELRESVRLSREAPPAVGVLARHLAITGAREEAERLVHGLEQRAEREYVSPVALANAYLGLSDFDRAFANLERAFTERRGWLVYLDVEPAIDPVRSEARFADLRRRVGL